MHGLNGIIKYSTELPPQTCRGAVDAWVAPYLSLVLQKLATCEHRALKDQLVLVVACALHYNPAAALAALAAQGVLPQVRLQLGANLKFKCIHLTWWPLFCSQCRGRKHTWQTWWDQCPLFLMPSVCTVLQALGGWFSMVMAVRSSGKPMHFRRPQEKKVRAYLLCRCGVGGSVRGRV